jgi:riboflavin biosynthesis pyrimidine reductase
VSDRIRRLWPDPRPDLDDDELLAVYAPPTLPWLRVNFIASADGAATRGGRSGPLGGPADRRVFDLLRRWADVILVGAGTARIEGYGALRLDDAAASWRAAHGLSPQPRLALVSGSLALDPHSAMFVDAPSRALIYTVTSAPADAAHALSRVADVVPVGDREVDPDRLLADLHSRGLRMVHSEGGPTAFAALVRAGAVDELCLTVAPTIEGGAAERIMHAALPLAPALHLESALLSEGDELLLRYRVSAV